MRRPLETMTAPQELRRDREQLQATIVSIVTVLVSAANYAFSLVVVRWLPSADYVNYAAVQSLLLVLGTGCMAAVPWAVARQIALDRRPDTASQALRSGLGASAVQGLAFALLAVAIVLPTAGWSLAAVSALAAFSLSIVTAPLGVLQGRQQLERIGALRVIETVVRIGLSLALLLAVAATPVSPILGFVAGSVVLFVLALWACRDVFPLRRAPAHVLGDLVRQSLSLGAVQVVLASLGAVDTLIVAMTGMDAHQASSYQVAALLGRVPLFLASAVALSYYQGFATSTPAELGDRLGQALRLFGLVGVPAALVVVAMPQVLLRVLVPQRAGEVAALLPATVTIGVAVGLVTVLATVHQARALFARALIVLLPVGLAQPLLLVGVGRWWGVEAFAAAGVGTALLALILVVVDLTRAGLIQLPRLTSVESIAVVAMGALAIAARWEAWLWLAMLPLAVGLCLRGAFGAAPARRRAAHRAG